MSKRSAGILLWRRNTAGGIEVLLAHPGGPLFARRDDGHWSLPKGEYEPGESPLEAAYREFAEEIGSPPPAGEPLPLGEAGQHGQKVNTIWALEGDLDADAVQSNSFEMEWPPRSGRFQQFPEMDRAAWFDLAQARVKLFPSQQPFLERLAEALDG